MWSVPERLQHGARAVLRPVGEFVHVSAIYLGLAVLTTLGLSLVLPSMRQQSQQLHEVVLAMFQADGGGDMSDDEGAGSDWSLPGAALPDEGAAPAVNPADGTADDAATTDPAAQTGNTPAVRSNFATFMAASLRDQPIQNVTQAQAHALRSYLARKYRIAPTVAGALVRAAFEIGRERHLDPQLVLAVVAIESRYNPFVESSVGAQGLMQVMTSVHRAKLRPSGGAASAFDPIVNMRVGTQILADCIRRRGSIEGGLSCYVGATGPSDGGYGARVLAERRRIALASGIPPTN
jgi:soluble lytic murein transglycosylase-like protein